MNFFIKKAFLLIFAILFSVSIFAQEGTSMFSIFVSSETFNREKNTLGQYQTKGKIFGLEYSEIKGFFGFRAGINYTHFTDRYDQYSLTNTIVGRPHPFLAAKIHEIGFPLTAQIYLGKKKLKVYGSSGIATTLSIPSLDHLETFFNINIETERNIYFQGVFGIGSTYQFSKHFGIDLGVNKRIGLINIGDDDVKPTDGFGVQLKLNYIFKK